MTGQRHRTGWSLTTEGGVFLCFTASLFLVAWLAQNNLLYLLVSTLLAMVVWSVLAAWVGLRGISVERLLPAEAYAGHAAPGAWRLHRGGLWPVVDLMVSEGSGEGAVRIDDLPRGTSEVSASWRFPRRGRHELCTIRLSTSAPFGLLSRWLEVDSEVGLWVWPRPVEDPSVLAAPPRRTAAVAEAYEVEQIRAYRPGDRPRDVSWAASARAGRPMVVERRGDGLEPLWVEVPALRGAALEGALAAAAGAVLRATAHQRPVGLRIHGKLWPPRIGESWRRELLTALAAVGEAGP